MKLNGGKTLRGALPFCMGNLIKPVLTFKPRDVMANNGLELHYVVVTLKICVSQVTLSTHCELPEPLLKFSGPRLDPDPFTCPLMMG